MPKKDNLCPRTALSQKHPFKKMKKVIPVSAALIFLFSCSGDQEEQEVKAVQKDSIAQQLPQKIEFPSLDSLPVTANLYHRSDSLPIIILCHQARFNKFEYTGIATTLWEMGYNCLAIDQRSGGPIVETFNETMERAEAKGKPVDFLDAEQDITAAVNFAAKKYGRKVILWGSSYSSTLALYVALENDNVMAVISFSPGDYFIKEKGALTEKLAGFTKPMFVTSSKEEEKELTQMLSKMKLNEKQVQFIPSSDGQHGSRALWKTYEHSEEYWKAIKDFLLRIKS